MAGRVTKHPQIPGFSYVRPLGAGGFAQVYLYEQDMPRRPVAVKALEPTTADAEKLRAVFESEADVMARLSNHPSIVSIYQASLSLEGLPYLAMEYCPESMGARTKGRPAPLSTVLDAGVRLAGALETAHRADVLHRDIKPSNVLLTTLGRPALTDFGIAHVVGRHLGAVGEVAMSIPWSAPEVVKLTTVGSVATEVWSLGATLYTFAFGRSPFELPERAQNTRARLSERITRAVYPKVRGAQGYEPFDEVLARAMQRDPDARFRSMEEFGRALQGLQRHYGYDVTPVEVTGPAAARFETAAVEGLPQAETSGRARGPVVSSVGRTSRAEARAAQLAEQRGTDGDGLVLDRPPPSPLRSALIGAGIALAAVAGVGALIWTLMDGGA